MPLPGAYPAPPYPLHLYGCPLFFLYLVDSSLLCNTVPIRKKNHQPRFPCARAKEGSSPALSSLCSLLPYPELGVPLQPQAGPASTWERSPSAGHHPLAPLSGCSQLGSHSLPVSPSSLSLLSEEVTLPKWGCRRRRPALCHVGDTEALAQTAWASRGSQDCWPGSCSWTLQGHGSQRPVMSTELGQLLPARVTPGSARDTGWQGWSTETRCCPHARPGSLCCLLRAQDAVSKTKFVSRARAQALLHVSSHVCCPPICAQAAPQAWAASLGSHPPSGPLSPSSCSLFLLPDSGHNCHAWDTAVFPLSPWPAPEALRVHWGLSFIRPQHGGRWPAD